jgi:hypothetical protein
LHCTVVILRAIFSDPLFRIVTTKICKVDGYSS